MNANYIDNTDIFDDKVYRTDFYTLNNLLQIKQSYPSITIAMQEAYIYFCFIINQYDLNYE